jgi:hypothetical protein
MTLLANKPVSACNSGFLANVEMRKKMPMPETNQYRPESPSSLERYMYRTSIIPMNLFIKPAGFSVPVEIRVIGLNQGRTAQ